MKKMIFSLLLCLVVSLSACTSEPDWDREFSLYNLESKEQLNLGISRNEVYENFGSPVGYNDFTGLFNYNGFDVLFNIEDQVQMVMLRKATMNPDLFTLPFGVKRGVSFEEVLDKYGDGEAIDFQNEAYIKYYIAVHKGGFELKKTREEISDSDNVITLLLSFEGVEEKLLYGIMFHDDNFKGTPSDNPVY